MPFTSAFISARPAAPLAPAPTPVPTDWAVVRRLAASFVPFAAGAALGAMAAFRRPARAPRPRPWRA